MGDNDRIAYARILSSFARELDADAVQHLVFIYLRDGNAPVDFRAEGAALRILTKLERLARFSFENPHGLIQIASDAGRLDWKKKFEDYVATRSAISIPKKKERRSRPLPSDEQQHLEEVHENARAKFVAIEERFQELWREPVTKANGLKVLRLTRKIAKELESAAEKGMERLSSLPRDSDGLSSSDSSSSIELSSSPETNSSSWLIQSGGERNRDIPLPKPRKPKPPPPYKQKYTPAVQETTRHNSPLLKPNSLQAPDQPPPVPPKKNSPRLPKRTTDQQSAMSQMCFNKPSVCIPLQKKESEEELKKVAMEEGDQTGDSGMESGSGSVQHGTITEWREAIQNPPPRPLSSGKTHQVTEDKDVKENQYTPISEGTKDRVSPYEKLNYDS